ncbi:MAG: putative O-glycosylation ligase, exosortase A system-associated [Betaproteobacteria bacterium]|nr:putative O-glycosylation ligase, exosortase A system-associated [Betaproteobacteria bacterium]
MSGGPEGTFIEDNNTLALAVIMVVPLFRYLQLEYDNKWIKRGCIAAILLCMASALGSQSRGALLALGGMTFFLWAKSPGKGKIGLLLLIAAPTLLLMMPESWYERMHTISDYKQDSSAMGRINAWWMAWNVAVDRFPIGAGFYMYEPDVFARYAPDPHAIHAAHSIYLQILGEHDFVGLALFLSIFILAWCSGSRVIRLAKTEKTLTWAGNLAGMCQVSLVGYAVGGAFLSLTYFDLAYYIVLILVVLEVHVKKQLATIAATNSSQTPTADKLKGALGWTGVTILHRVLRHSTAMKSPSRSSSENQRLGYRQI